MAIRDTFLNMLTGSPDEAQKVSNSVAIKSARDFLRNGSRDRIYPSWSDVKMPDSDMYSGYSYAVIQKRGNKVASLAKNNLKTTANEETTDAFQKKNETVWHPYLKLIEDSTDFTEKQFWKNISIYLDLAGRYYLGVVRNSIQPKNPKLPTITTDITKFIMLNPYEIRRVVDKDGHIAGYIERKKDGRYREWPLYQIIEMRELNPFDPDKQVWAMTDAAKDAVYTINQSGDYTRQSLNGNIDAPGIITTDVLLSDEDFANFRARITQHTKGEPLFGNGSGAINWDSMQIDLDKAALLDINEINRTTLFAVSGTSKTALGIEQSGTTRETARVQSEQFISDTAQPRLEDIVDFLNLDYKRHYMPEYKKTGYTIEVTSAVGRDYDTETKATALKQQQFQLAMTLVQAGYTTESAYQFAEGDIDFKDLELEKGLDKPQNPEQGGDEQASDENSPNSPKNGPQSDSSGGVDSSSNSNEKSPQNEANSLASDLQPHSDLVEGKQGDPLDKQEVAHTCTCENGVSVDTFVNEVQEEEGKLVKNAYDEFLDEIRGIEKETINACARKISVNAFDESDIIGSRKKKSLIEKLKTTINKYWFAVFPMFATNSMANRNKEFDKSVDFVFNNAIQKGIDLNAERVAEGHMDTILNDILEASNKAYTEVTEQAAAKLIVDSYDNNPSKWEEWFDYKPTMADALSSIRRTDILDKNRKIYEKANKMAFEGYSRGDIVKAVRNEYKDISVKRAETIARNETSRAFTRSQFEADKQFLNSIGKLGDAYKVMYSRRPENEKDKICAFCQTLIDQSNANPVPFEEPFLKYGESIEVQDGDKVQIFTANYENIEGGCNHVNCYARDTQVYTDEGWKRVDELTGKELFWSIDPETKKPEWVKAKARIEGYAETLLRFQNKNFDMAVTKDHNMYVESQHRTGDHRIGRRQYKPHLKEAQNLAVADRFYGGVEWSGVEPQTIKLGDYDIPAELYCKFMGYYLSEGSANYYKYKKAYQGSISQNKHHNKFWKTIQNLPFRVWNGKTDFTFTDESVVKHCMQFGKCNEKYIPNEIKELSPRLLRVFLEAFTDGDGNREYSEYSDAWSTRVFTSSVKLRDDLTEIVQKAGYRPTVHLLSKAGTPYKGTNYKSNYDVWAVAICNRLHNYNRSTKCSEIEYHDNVYCVELEKNHTLWVMYNGRCWWSGNCQCGYKLVFKNEAGDFVKTLNFGPDDKNLNGGKGSGNFGHSGRPGEVGGSGKEKTVSSETRTRSFMLGDTVKISSKGKEYIGTLESVSSGRDSEIEVKMPDGKSIKVNVKTATLVQEDGSKVEVPFYNVKMVKNVDAVETLPKDRRTKKQQQALNEVNKIVKISDKELTYLKNNCSEESAVALRDELVRASKEGVDFSNVSFAHNGRLNRTQGKVVYQPYATGTKLPELQLQMSVKWLLDGEYYKSKQQKNYDDGWHTSSEIAGILRHEIGHIKSSQIVLRNFDSNPKGRASLTAKEVKNRNEQFCENLLKSLGYSVWSLPYGSGKSVSKYAVKDRKSAEVIAESYSNPDFSEVTKRITKELDKQFKKRGNGISMKFENKAKIDDVDGSLCTGYPMSEEDWDVLHDKKPKVYVPDNIKLNER